MLLNKFFFLSALVIFLSQTSFSQVIWTVPAFPTKYDDVTVYFDATQGNRALEGFTGDVYAHTGVITSESINGSDWKYVIGNWGTADSRVLMTRVSEDLYSIRYNISDFYGVPAQEEVLKMAFVFRNVTGSIVGRSTDGTDIYTDVFSSNIGLFITLNSPSSGDIVITEDDSLYVDVLVSDTADLQIFNDGLQIYFDHTDRASFYFHPPSVGLHELEFVATTDTVVQLIKKYIVIMQDEEKTNPPAGSVNGLNYFSDSTYIFQLYAPFKEYVFLLTPANGFTADTGFQLNPAEDGSTYWIELPRNLFKNDQNTYQYLVSDGIRVADPHSEVVLDPNHDDFIDPLVMTTLPPYPTGMTQGIVTAFDTTYQSYDFEVDSFIKTEKTNLVIYELLLRDFLAKHNFKTLEDTLDYFVKLGINAIELMPVNEFEGNISWGYNPSFHMAVDKYYGTRQQLKSLIDAAHQRGIAVILDVVFNHGFSQSPLAQMYWDATNFRPAPGSPYMNVTPRHPFNVGYDINHESIATKIWVKRILSYWIEEFKVDGFRFDLSKGMTQFNSGNDAGLMARYDPGRIAILKDYADFIWSHDSTSYVILEHFADNNEETVLSDYGMMLWGNINHEFNEAAKGFQSDLEGADYTFKEWDEPNLIAYMECHDEERLMVRLLNEGDSEGSYNTRHLPTALKRVAAASAIYYSIPGPKMIWQFGELGYDFSINRCPNGTISNDCRTDPKPIRWDYLQNPDRENLRRVTESLIHLKINYPTFSTDDFVFNDANFYLKTVHLNHPDMDAVTLVNFRVINSDINPKFQYTGTWYEYFTGDSLIVTDTQKKITFGPGEYRIYTSERITPPDGFFTRTKDVAFLTTDFYPSLVTTQDWISGTLSGTGRSKIESISISDVRGIQNVLSTFYSLGEDFRFQLPDGMIPGIYFVQVRTKEQIYVGKVIVQ